MSNASFYMRKAIEQAEKAKGRTSPNPFVGAVIVKHEHVVGEGYTQPCGMDHAEVVALKDAGKQARDADMYVTLEPCCHWGRTPPCTDAIIRAGIKRVYIGVLDPNPKVCNLSGGILEENGIEVHSGIEEEAILRQLRPYLHFVKERRPFVTVKIAASLDGKLAAEDGTSQWITGEAARNRVHRMRNRTDAILTGIGTVLGDDPRLNVRLDEPCGAPVRVILDSELRIPLESRIVRSANAQQVWVFTTQGKAESDKARSLNELGVEVVSVGSTPEGLTLDGVLQELYSRGIMMAMVEAGPKVVASFLREGLADQLTMFYGNCILGGGKGFAPEPVAGTIGEAVRWKMDSFEQLGDDLMVELIRAQE